VLIARTPCIPSWRRLCAGTRGADAVLAAEKRGVVVSAPLKEELRRRKSTSTAP